MSKAYPMYIKVGDKWVPVPAISGKDGKDGGYYSPSDAGGAIRFTGSKPGMPTVPDIPIPGGGSGPLQPLTFTGAVEASYDGTETVTVPIPTGGGGGVNWEKIAETQVTGSDVTSIRITEDINGKPFNLQAVYVIADLHAALQEGSDPGKLVKSAFSSQISNVWGYGMINSVCPKTGHTYVTYCVARADDGRLLTVNNTVAYNNNSIPDGQVYVYSVDVQFLPDGEKTMLPGKSYIDAVIMGSYAKTIGVNTKIIVYGVRA